MASSLQEALTAALAEIDTLVDTSKQRGYKDGVEWAAAVVRRHLCNFALALPSVVQVPGQQTIQSVVAKAAPPAAPAAPPKPPEPPSEPIPQDWEDAMAKGFEAVKELVTHLMETGHKKDGEKLAETAFSRGIKPPNKRAQG